jgi:hypothetical protein
MDTLEKIRALLKKAGYTESEVYNENGESKIYYIFEGEVIGITVLHEPDYEIVKDVFGERIADEQIGE